MLLIQFTGCDSGRTRGRVPDRTFPHSRQEGMYAPESSHRSNKSAMEALSPEEATWEMEDKMREAYPSMLQNEQGSSE